VILGETNKKRNQTRPLPVSVLAKPEPVPNKKGQPDFYSTIQYYTPKRLPTTNFQEKRPLETIGSAANAAIFYQI